VLWHELRKSMFIYSRGFDMKNSTEHKVLEGLALQYFLSRQGKGVTFSDFHEVGRLNPSACERDHKYYFQSFEKGPEEGFSVKVDQATQV
jgi:hypothetical protein